MRNEGGSFRVMGRVPSYVTRRKIVIRNAIHRIMRFCSFKRDLRHSVAHTGLQQLASL